MPQTWRLTEKRLIPPYNEEELLKILIGRLNECTFFAATVGKTATKTQIVCISYILVAGTGQYMEGFQV